MHGYDGAAPIPVNDLGDATDFTNADGGAVMEIARFERDGASPHALSSLARWPDGQVGMVRASGSRILAAGPMVTLANARELAVDVVTCPPSNGVPGALVMLAVALLSAIADDAARAELRMSLGVVS